MPKLSLTLTGLCTVIFIVFVGMVSIPQPCSYVSPFWEWVGLLRILLIVVACLFFVLLVISAVSKDEKDMTDAYFGDGEK